MTLSKTIEGTIEDESIIILCVGILPVLLVVTCLWCFKSKKSMDEEDEKAEEEEDEEEKRSINTGLSVNSQFTMEREEDLWGKLRSLFPQSADAKEVLSKPTAKISGRQSLYDKPPANVSLVQPQPQGPGDGVPSTSSKRPSIISIGFGRSVNGSSLSGSDHIPQGTLGSFDKDFESSMTEPPKEKLGSLVFSTIYLFAENALCVKIIKGIDLKPMDIGGTSDPFVKCCLLPDKKRKLETKIRRKNLNPVWNEKMSFEGLTYEKIKERVLYLQVFDYDRFSRNDPIGELHIPLHAVQLGEEIKHTYPLQPCKGSNKRGQLQLSLQYQTLKGILDVEVVRGRNLKPMDLNGTSDPYVKIWLINRGKKVQKKKTAVKKNTLDPLFNEKFQFEIPMIQLRDIQLEITVMDFDTIGRNDTIGKIYLGHKSTGLERQHWIAMLADPKKPVVQYHVLKI